MAAGDRIWRAITGVQDQLWPRTIYCVTVPRSQLIRPSRNDEHDVIVSGIVHSAHAHALTSGVEPGNCPAF